MPPIALENGIPVWSSDSECLWVQFFLGVDSCSNYGSFLERLVLDSDMSRKFRKL